MKTTFLQHRPSLLLTVLLALFHFTGTAQTWAELANNQGFDNQVLSLYVDDATNTLYAGGQFTKVDGVTVNGIAKWDGTQWSAMGDGFGGTSPYVYGITKYKNDIYATGHFTSSGGTTLNGIARWDGTKWQPLDGGLELLTQYDYGVALHEFNNELYVGGKFQKVGTAPIQVSNIAKWDGTKWSAVGGAVNDLVLTMHTHNNELYIGGSFVFAQQVGTGLQYRIAKLSGNDFVAVGTTGLGDATAAWSVEYINTYKGKLYAGGNFNVLESGATVANHIATWDGAQWATVGTPVGVSTTSTNPVRSLIVYNDKLYAGGQFTSAGMSGNTGNLAYWDGSTWTGIGTGTNDMINAMVVYGGKLMVAGRYTIAGGQNIKYLASYSEQPTTVEGIAQEMKVTAAPNPFSQMATITIQSDRPLQNTSLSVYDVTGRNVRTYHNISRTVTVQRAQLVAGTYYYTIKNENEVLHKGQLIIK